jgi:AcrR family transcriptional regulator
MHSTAMYDVQVPGAARSDVRVVLVERAAAMLARREPVTLRALVAGTGVSTMAVYTHFGGMSGLWSAVRQEGFTRLATHLTALRPSNDPVTDLTAIGAAYVNNALTSPALYRAMFDVTAELEDPQAAADTFGVLVSGAARARDAGRLADACEPQAVATQLWATGHGLVMLVLSGVLPRTALDAHAPVMTTALLVAAGDDEQRCRTSVAAGWMATQRNSVRT